MAAIVQNRMEANCEDSPLIVKSPQALQLSILAQRYSTTHKCITSKAANLVLLWSFTISLVIGAALSLNIYMQRLHIIWALLLYVFIAAIFCLFPLAGLVADLFLGPHRTVIVSLYMILSAVAITTVPGVILYFAFTSDNSKYIVFGATFCGIFGGISILFLLVGYAGFSANVIQFGMDQLHDSPADDQSLFIHWYMWVYYSGILFIKLGWNLLFSGNSDAEHSGIALLLFIPLLIIVILVVSLCVGHHRKRWFLVEPGRVNPYKLVHRVTKFSHQHRVPIHRSAFTYCEDGVPSGLDLAKKKYGGPFTTEQVEDVKAFYGILKMIFCFGPVFCLEMANDLPLPVYLLNGKMNASSSSSSLGIVDTYINNGSLSLLIVCFFIPLYLFLLRPFISRYIPGMLKRMGIGILLALLSLICKFVLDIAASINYKEDGMCFPVDKEAYSPFKYMLPLIQVTLSALSNMFIYIASIEFICSQSPHSMKGLLIGLIYAIKGLFQLLSVVIMVPFLYWKHLFPSCGFGYYLVNIVIGMVELGVYVWVSRRYKYRERDEPSKGHQFAEEYYSRSKVFDCSEGFLS